MIPKIIHFIYLKGPKTHPFGLTHYLSIKSNIVINNLTDVRIYSNDFNYLMTCNWFDRLLSEFDFIKLIDTDLIKEYKGVEVNYLSHQADILKLLIMDEVGGIYSDLDSIAVVRLPDEFFNEDVPIFCSEDENNIPSALCNGYFLSPKGNEFINKMQGEYVDYYYPLNESDWIYPWAEFAVGRPWNIYKENPNLVKLLPAKSFQPLYLDYKSRLRLYFLDYQLPEGSYQLHLWENVNWDIMKILDEEYFEKCDTTFTRVSKNFMNL